MMGTGPRSCGVEAATTTAITTPMAGSVGSAARSYEGFGDGEGGFHAVFREVFEKIDQDEEMEESVGTYHVSHSFGNSRLGHSGVGDFYRNWAEFVSNKDFRLADEYNPSMAPNRYVRRRMEAENDKARKKARKEYTDTVRNLVEFVRKRDPRWKAREAALAVVPCVSAVPTNSIVAAARFD
jgi:DnaJ family protein A protein 5